MFSDVGVHGEAAVLLVVAFVGALVQIYHLYSRRPLRLQHIPGTIASSISIGAETNLAHLLNAQTEQDFRQILHNRNFCIDPQTMKIVMGGEAGYKDTMSARS